MKPPDFHKHEARALVWIRQDHHAALKRRAERLSKAAIRRVTIAEVLEDMLAHALEE